MTLSDLLLILGVFYGVPFLGIAVLIVVAFNAHKFED